MFRKIAQLKMNQSEKRSAVHQSPQTHTHNSTCCIHFCTHFAHTYTHLYIHVLHTQTQPALRCSWYATMPQSTHSSKPAWKKKNVTNGSVNKERKIQTNLPSTKGINSGGSRVVRTNTMPCALSTRWYSASTADMSASGGLSSSSHL